MAQMEVQENIKAVEIDKGLEELTQQTGNLVSFVALVNEIGDNGVKGVLEHE